MAITTRHALFYSDGMRLEGLLDLPAGLEPGERRPALVLCSGMLGLKELIPGFLRAPLLAAGFICFAFDYRGFGTSDGPRGRLMPREQAEDVINAVTFIAQQPEVDAQRIALVGWGLGGGVVIQAAAEDERAAAVVCLNGVGDMGRVLRGLRPYGEWLAFSDRLARDRDQRVRTGRSAAVNPWEILPLDADSEPIVHTEMYGKHERFGTDLSLASAEALSRFRPEAVVGQIAPRPLLIVHGERNALHPVDEARRLYAQAAEPKTLRILPGATHLNWMSLEHPVFGQAMGEVVLWLRDALHVA
jgi:alpha-beta hydrolase superfamily lysophospholipase